MIAGRRSGLVLLVVLALAAAGCGSSTVSPSSGAQVAACGLVPAMDEIVGRAALAPASGYTRDGKDRCTWIFGRDPSRYVGLTTGAKANHDDAIRQFGPGEPIAGVGDDARWWQAARTLSVATGDRSFQIDLQLDESDVSRELAVEIARSTLERFEAR